MLDAIDLQWQAVQKNLQLPDNESLAVVVNLTGEEPWDELWPRSKEHFYKMTKQQWLQLADFFHMLDSESTDELSEEDFNMLEMIIGSRPSES